jgi:hypothetical protein
MLIEHRHCHLN